MFYNTFNYLFYFLFFSVAYSEQLLLFLVIFFFSVGRIFLAFYLADLSWQLPAWGNSVDRLLVMVYNWGTVLYMS